MATGISARIKADGKKSARIVLIGEAGGRDEAKALRPFVGWSGKLLAKWWADVGLSRKDLWIDNVFPFTPPMVRGTPQLSMVHPDDIKFWTANLHERLSELTDVRVIVPTGNLALKALTGLKDITKYRGSILNYWIPETERQVKVIPTIHPAATARRPIWAKACVADWQRIAEEAKTSEITLPQREHFTHPTLDDLKWFEENEIGGPKGGSLDEVLAIDCEWAPTQLLCVGFACRNNFSFTVPTTVEYWSSKARLQTALEYVKAWCGNVMPKVLHHGHSDAYVLHQLNGIRINNYVWDTLAMHHALDPNSDHDLAYLASVYTRQPYWKDEAKDPEKIAKYASNFDALLHYNGIDVAVTRELFEVFYAMLTKRGLVEFYYEHYADLFEPMIDMMLTGINVDSTKRIQRQMQLTGDIISIQDEISEIIGEQCYAKKDLKKQVLMKYFHDVLKLPKVMRTRKRKNGEKVKTASIDEVAVRRYMLRFPQAERIGQLVLNHRRKHSLLTFYSEGRIDDDGRFRSSYAPYADNWRFRSSESPLGTGGNGQNVDRETRDIYIPDNF